MLCTSGWAFSISSRKDHGVRPAAHALRKLAPLLIAHVSRRCADEPGDGVALHVLGHVQANEGVLVAEDGPGQGLGKFGLPNARRAKEEESGNGPVFFL